MLTKDKIKQIHSEITEALKVVAQKNGLTLSPDTKILFNAQTFKFTAEFGDKAAVGEKDPKLLNNMRKHGWKFGLSEADIGKTFKHQVLGRTTLDGMSGTQKCAITAEDGKQYLMHARDVKRYL